MKKVLKNKKGFTLVELMVVVAIMGILVAVAVPVYNNVTEKAAIQTDESNARTLQSAVMQMRTMNDGKLETAVGTAVTGTIDLDATTALVDGSGAAVTIAPNYVAEFPVIKSKKYTGFQMTADGIVTCKEAGTAG